MFVCFWKVFVLTTRFGRVWDDDPGVTFRLPRLKSQESGLNVAPKRKVNIWESSGHQLILTRQSLDKYVGIDYLVGASH